MRHHFMAPPLNRIVKNMLPSKKKAEAFTALRPSRNCFQNCRRTVNANVPNESPTQPRIASKNHNRQHFYFARGTRA